MLFDVAVLFRKVRLFNQYFGDMSLDCSSRRSANRASFGLPSYSFFRRAWSLKIRAACLPTSAHRPTRSPRRSRLRISC